MLKNIARAGKIFLFGILLGTFFCILSEAYFKSAEEATRGFLEAKVSALPSSPALLSLAIFLNNLLVVILASVGSICLILFITWGRKNISLWQKMDESRFSRVLDRYVWRFTKYIKPKFAQIKSKINRDIFIIGYGLPTLVMIVNGWFFGFLFTNEFLEQNLAGIVQFLRWIAPHGIIEIPVILASAGLGYSFIDDLLDSLYQDKTKEVRKKARLKLHSKRTAKALVILTVLLSIAALIEVFLTPQIA
ncbi:hypothetical protein AKJ53_01390 [candidate division MSBL1 archaeon SCGC-AAA382F02]|uniref:Stage II sporulation protein M n=1 Tax=candidate division MSBL1 archaeon SCGC-AAA382F02 TaxID=1698282 RepID=A0A133VI24_9EURY|nr:hypothetical protein AKJ53_01390 [candidate division MSBL1 archaeon SCGC-AAA382F02]